MNPELATKILRHIIGIFNKKFDIDFLELSEQVILKFPRDFNLWFFQTILGSSEVKEVQEVKEVETLGGQTIINSYLNKIKCFPIPIQSVHSTESIDDFVRDLI